MSEIILSLMLWIGDNTSYDVYLNTPIITLTNQHNMCAQYGINNKSRCEGQRMAGFYDRDQTIYLGLHFKVDNSHYQSQLLHELVHYVQWENGEDGSTCLGLLELEAYELQDQWREQQGLEPLLGDFNRLMLEASCDA